MLKNKQKQIIKQKTPELFKSPLNKGFPLLRFGHPRGRPLQIQPKTPGLFKSPAPFQK
jgi:hypothetical protein